MWTQPFRSLSVPSAIVFVTRTLILECRFYIAILICKNCFVHVFEVLCPHQSNPVSPESDNKYQGPYPVKERLPDRRRTVSTGCSVTVSRKRHSACASTDKRKMNSHLITIEVGIECGTNERMQFDCFTFYQNRLKCLNTQSDAV